MIQQVKPGRNDDCPCGSKKKFKFCCGGPVDARPAKKLSPKGFQQAFLFLIKCICAEKEVNSVTISLEGLESLGKDEILAIGYDKNKDSFIFKPVKVEKKAILTPDKRIIV